MTWETVDFNDLTDILKLKTLVGGSRVADKLALGEHPLAAGFRALKIHMLAQRALTEREQSAFAQLQIDARSIFRLEQSWRPCAARFAKELKRSESCRERLFEIDVYRSCLRGCADTSWTHFVAGACDFGVSEPPIQVECKHIYESWDPRRLRRKVEEAARQHREVTRLVVAVTFELRRTMDEIEEILRDPRQDLKWLAAMPEVSSVLLVARRDSRPGLKLGLRGTEWARREVLELRNDSASQPLPRVFKFDSTAKTVGRYALA